MARCEINGPIDQTYEDKVIHINNQSNIDEGNNPGSVPDFVTGSGSYEKFVTEVT